MKTDHEYIYIEFLTPSHRRCANYGVPGPEDSVTVSVTVTSERAQ